MDSLAAEIPKWHKNECDSIRITHVHCSIAIHKNFYYFFVAKVENVISLV